MKPDEKARQKIDQLLQDAWWEAQVYKNLNLGSSLGIAVREFPVYTDYADYLLFVESSVLAAEIVENLEAALDQFRGVLDGLEGTSK